MNQLDIQDLKRAKLLLENPGLAARLAQLVGRPIELAIDRLPVKYKERIGEATQLALTKAVRMAVRTMSADGVRHPKNRLHKMAVVATGAGGGAFGMAALPIELPLSTTIMLRSIGDIARSKGEVLSQVEAQLACIEVFALGGRSDKDDASESGYYAIRAMLAKAVSEAAQHFAKKGVLEGAPQPLLRLIALVAAQFGVRVSEKVAAQAIPVIGALGGSAINLVFMEHFQSMAEGHFTVRMLERKYGAEEVARQYELL